MSISQPDASLEHLYPVFRQKLEQVLAEVAQATGEPWQMMELLQRAEQAYGVGEEEGQVES